MIFLNELDILIPSLWPEWRPSQCVPLLSSQVSESLIDYHIIQCNIHLSTYIYTNHYTYIDYIIHSLSPSLSLI
jgi:hypothetical protein